jgi:F0F1-type ATP synthase assembly protein I
MVPVENRASANAVVLTSFTVAGLGLGPVMVGGLSDYLAGLNIEASLAWAMAVGASLNLVAGVFFFMTSQRLKASPPNWETSVPA